MLAFSLFRRDMLSDGRCLPFRSGAIYRVGESACDAAPRDKSLHYEREGVASVGHFCPTDQEEVRITLDL
jgi:hypothetical protein